MMVDQWQPWPLWAYVLLLAALGSIGVIRYKIIEERKIQSLGGHAPQVSKLPFGEYSKRDRGKSIVLIEDLGIDTVYTLLKAVTSHRNIEWYRELLEKGGGHTVEGSLGGDRAIFSDDPENIKAVLATQFRQFGKGEGFHHRWRTFLGDSIFTTDLDQWHASRQLIRPQFIKDRVSDLETFERHVSTLLLMMDGSGKIVDVQSLFFRYTLDAATDFLLGHSVDSLHHPQAKFAKAFADCQQYQSHVARTG